MPPRTKTIQDLRKELQAKERRLDVLSKRRGALAKRLEAINHEIDELNGANGRKRRGRKPGPKPGKRGRKPGPKPGPKPGKRGRKAAPRPQRASKRATGKPLAQYIKNVLAKAKKPMRVRDIMIATAKEGYKSSSKDFYNIVASTLRAPKVFKRLKRGVYALIG